MKSQEVGLIGVGLLGTAMAERLHASGFKIIGFDVAVSSDAPSFIDFREKQNDLFDRCDTIILSLPNSNIVQSVLDNASIRPQSTIIDTTTGAPNDTIQIADRLRRQEVEYLDATIAGSSVQMRSGNAVALIGGSATAYASTVNIFDAIAPKRFYVGPSGNGAKTKLVVNLAIGMHRAVLAEALSLANVLQLDLASTLEVLKGTAAYSVAMDSKGEKMVQQDFAPQARLRQHAKDVGLMLDSAHEANHQLPFSQLHFELLQQLIADGHGDLDNSAIVKAFTS